jgi:diguanylate cyclase (GGDEF)-like protein
VLIVEDDRSQAIFAESILRKAGMTTRMCTDPLAALDQLDEFQPGADPDGPVHARLRRHGTDLDHPRARSVRVDADRVPLGRAEREKHFEALDSGGDDFLSKPIRPKHLIAAVTNRVRRARHLERRGTGGSPRDPVSGLYQRAHVLDQINALLTRDDATATLGGLMYIEIDSAASTRERVGMLAFDALLGQVGAFIASHVGANDLATRYGDSSFLLPVPASATRPCSSAWPRACAIAPTREKFDQDGRSFSLGLSIGICSFAARLGEVGAMLNGAERAIVRRTPSPRPAMSAPITPNRRPRRPARSRRWANRSAPP